ncbi:MAG: hypothetical protein H0V97_11440 [Actinobacteria bacterium]|nr:hypothetical protein [Actinomycetota bacterium]
MKAIVHDEYGSPDVLELRDIDKPSLKEDEVLVRVHAAGVNAADWHLLRGAPYVMRLMFGLRKPKNTVRGRDMAGRVEGDGHFRYPIWKRVASTTGPQWTTERGTNVEHGAEDRDRQPSDLRFCE